jgi:hypothetical protein
MSGEQQGDQELLEYIILSFEDKLRFSLVNHLFNFSSSSSNEVCHPLLVLVGIRLVLVFLDEIISFIYLYLIQ